jgi:hypothetical protein
MAQPGPVHIAHHLHAPAHVIAAIQAGLPTLVLIREPEDAILEFVIRKPALTIAQAIRGYLRFYTPLLRGKERFVVGRFDEVTTDLGRVIRRVNERFGTSFREFEHTDENVRACFEAIDRDYERHYGSGPQFARVVARPSEARDSMKNDLRRAYRQHSLAASVGKADRLYGTVSAGDFPLDA